MDAGAPEHLEHRDPRQVQTDTVDVDVRSTACRPASAAQKRAGDVAREPSERLRAGAAGRRRLRRLSRRCSTSTPNASSARSVWSRVGTSSITRVRPGACRPARSTPLLTCALGTCGSCVIACSEPPSMVSGGRPSSASMRAPMRSAAR